MQVLAGRDRQNLEWEMIKLVVVGQNSRKSSMRRAVWHQLTLKSKVTALSPLVELEKEGVVIKLGDRYQLSHDLFEEWGLIDFFTEHWLAAYRSSTIVDFWSEFPRYLEFTSPLPVFKKWLSIYVSLHREAFEAIIKSSLDFTILKEGGLTVYHIALSFLNEEVKELLFQASPSDKPSIQEFVQVLNESDKEELEEFAISLVSYSNDGSQSALNELEMLMTLIKHRAQISEYGGLDFSDQESQLTYILDSWDANGELSDFKDFILEDTDRIAEVLESDFGRELSEIVLEDWFTDLDDEQIDNLTDYAQGTEEETDDEDVLDRILDYVLNSEKLSNIKDFILDDSARIAKVLESDYGKESRSELVQEWMDDATDVQLENLKRYAEEAEDQEVLDLLNQ